MGRLANKVAFITGAARGQGRAHAIRLAEEGADIIAFDLCQQMDSVAYPMSTRDDLDETVKLVEGAGRRIVAVQGDVRDRQALDAAVQSGVAELGRLDFVIPNAGILALFGDASQQPAGWHDSIDVMLSGVFHTVEAAKPVLLEQNQGGSIVITSSTAGLKGLGRGFDGLGTGSFGYAASKHGVVGLMRLYANAFAPHSIRVNTVHPTGVNSAMVVNEGFGEWVGEHPVMAESMQNAMPVDLVECSDIANAVAFLCSNEARYITGVALPVDAGFVNR
jgi:SDR family mycofactocin-dependent oxidoreductase